MSNLAKRSFNFVLGISTPLLNNPARMAELSRWLMRLFFLMATVAGLLWLSQRPVFALRQMQIEPLPGQIVKHINLSQVKNQVIEQVQGNFFTVRLENIKEAFEALPWVRHASVRRVWPNGLAVSIEEQKPLGIWGSRSEHKLMNGFGEIFSASLAQVDDPSNLIEVSGPTDSSKEVMQLYQKASRWFAPWNVDVVSVNLSDRYSWSVKLSNGIRIEFGRDEEAQGKALTEERVARLIEYWPKAQERLTGRVDVIDLRYSNGFAVHLARAGNKNTEPDTKKSGAQR
jgi:cell division protein FtsQ